MRPVARTPPPQPDGSGAAQRQREDRRGPHIPLKRDPSPCTCSVRPLNCRSVISWLGGALRSAETKGGAELEPSCDVTTDGGCAAVTLGGRILRCPPTPLLVSFISEFSLFFPPLTAMKISSHRLLVL